VDERRKKERRKRKEAGRAPSGSLAGIVAEQPIVPPPTDQATNQESLVLIRSSA
jgi:hypothetical protein